MSPTPIIYFSELSFADQCLERLKKIGDVIEFACPADADQITLSKAVVIFAPLTYKFDSSFFRRTPKLKIIASNTTGIPHIDQFEAQERGIKICALHNQQPFLESITPTAEHTIGLLISGWRKIPAAFEDTKRGVWNRWDWGSPKMLSKCSLGIVGYGRLGKKVGKIAVAMGMRVRWFDPNVQGGEYSLEDLASKSEILSIHAVANTDTHKIVSRKILERLPRGAMVVNTARGELVDLDALIDLLEIGHLHAAALDTLDGEYCTEFQNTFSTSRFLNYCRNHDNLILPPHIGGSTKDAWLATQMRVIELIEDELIHGI